MAAQGERDKDKAYEYLCHLEEAKKWLESVIAEPLPPASELEDVLQNGVILCKLGLNLLPDDPIWRKVYDINESKFKSKGLDYRHTDNINFWLSSLQKLGLPKEFYPVMTDIYHKKNMPKLIYCLHALSHLLKKKGKVADAVDDLYGTAKFSQDALVQTSKTLKANDLPAFGVVENLVDEELQYQAIGLTDSFEEERTPSPNDVTPDTKLSDPLFDDPKYVSSKMLREGPQAASSGNEPTDGASDGKAEASSTPVVVVPCQGNGIRTSLYERHSMSRRRSSTADSKIETALQLVNESLEKEDSKETLKSLQNPEANLPFVYQDADKYLAALRMEKEQGMPNNVLRVFSGIDRELCEFLLEKMNPGAYIVRDSRTLQGAYVFSFRNQTGIKHWRLNAKNGKFYWGASAHYDSLDAFVQNFVESLSLVTKLHIYPGMAAILQPLFNTPEQQTIIDSLRQADSGLTYGQVCRVIKQVNSEIRQRRKSSITAEQFMAARPQVEETWATSMVVNVNRAEAESILNKEGEPGSFIVRPSEKTLGDYALAFRTKTDIRHWKITQDSSKYYVHPRPNPYNSLGEIILHFREAVGLEIGLTMTPLLRTPTNQDTKEDSSSTLTPPIPLPRSNIKSSTMGRTAMPTASMSKLNPANLTSWSVDDVCQWLTGEGLGRFIDIFRDNAVDGECLLSLDNNLLKEDLGISALGHRSRLLKRVQVLRESVHPGRS